MHQVNKNYVHVSDIQLEDLPGVQWHIISKLKQAGIQSVLDLAVYIPHELVAGGEYEGNTISADKDTISELVLKAITSFWFYSH
jgi:hypothetical protein